MIKHKSLIVYILFLIISFSIIGFHFYDNKEEYENEIHLSKDILYQQFLKKKEKRSNGYIKSDRPDQFLEVMRSLKVNKDGENYEDGYKLKEVRKAQRIKNSNQRLQQTITDQSWIERGPSNVPGRTRTLVIDKNDPSGNTWITGSVAGGIWKTSNKGESWSPLTETLPNLSISHIAQSNSNPNILYACTGEGYGNIDGVKGDGILKSIDGGNTWIPIESTINNENFQIVNRIIIDPQNENNIVVCTSANPNGLFYRSSIFKSIDGGNNWTKTYQVSNGSFHYAIQQIIADPSDFSIQFAAIKNTGIIKSTDEGNTWSPVNGISTNGRIEMSISEVDSKYIFASIAGEGNGSSDGNLYYSSDNGDNWHFLDKPVYPEFLGGQGWYDNTIISHPFDSLSFYIGGVDLWKININTTLNTFTYKRISDAYGNTNQNGSIIINGQDILPGFHPDHHSLITRKITSNTFYIINTNDGGVYYSDTGLTPGEADGSWTFAGNGYNTTQFYGIDKKTGSNQYIGGSQDNGTWISNSNPNKNSTYKRWLGGDGFETVWHSKKADLILGSIYNNNIYKSSDGGNTYYKSIDGLTDTNENGPFITKLANSKKNPDTVFAIGKSGIWKTTDFGDNWTLKSIDNNTWSLSPFMDITVSDADPDIVWAGNYFGSNSLQVSSDNGNTFNAVEGSNALNVTGYISGIKADPIETETAYLLFSYPNYPKILKTEDFGENWVDISGFQNNNSSSTGFPNVAVYDLLIFPYNNDYLWAGTEIGIYESLDGGNSWHPLNGVIPAVCIWDMKYSDNQVYVGTHGRGIWSIDIPLNPQPNITNQIVLLNGNEFEFTIDAEADSIIVINENKDVIKRNQKNLQEGENVLFLSNDELENSQSLQLISFKNNKQFQSTFTAIDSYNFNSPVDEYYNDFKDFTTVSDFESQGINFNSSIVGFSFAALHSNHPFEGGTAYSYLRTPIIVDKENPNIFYKDVTLISSSSGYVSVEAKKGNEEWVSISKEYDSSFDETWQYYSDLGSNGAQTLEVRHQIRLDDYYAIGDTLLIRFKIYAEEPSKNWGWAITYLNIQSIVEEEVTSSFNDKLFNSIKLYPNVIQNRSTQLYIDSPFRQVIHYQVFDLSGKTLIESSTININIGKNEIPLNLSSLKKGVYIVAVWNKNSKSTFKIIIE